jgi:hypothetical protein
MTSQSVQQEQNAKQARVKRPEVARFRCRVATARSP